MKFQINLAFFLNHCFHFAVYPRRILIVKNFGFIENEIFHDIKNEIIKINICLFTPLLEKALSLGYGLLSKIINYNSVPVDSFIWR